LAGQDEHKAPIELRPYQQAAVQAVYAHLHARDDNPCIVIPTGGGKTPIMARITHDAVTRWNGRVIILAHVQELLQQTYQKLLDTAPEMVDLAGLHCAGLGERETDRPCIVASIASAVRKGDIHFVLSWPASACACVARKSEVSLV
jgi:DNA repair protein RadD